MSISVIIPTIPPRADLLARAVESVAFQERPADAVHIAVDVDHRGAVDTRNRALFAATTEWVAFLDDDDELLPNHLAELATAAEASGADVIYPSFRCLDEHGEPKTLPESIRSGQPFDGRKLRQRSYIPVTTMVRTELAHQVGGFSYPRRTKYEDWGLWLKLLDADARFHHHPVVTWVWHHHGANTAGRPERW